MFFNLKTDPERGGRELSIAHKIRVETYQEGSNTPLQVSEKGVKGGRSDLDFAQNEHRYFCLNNFFDNSFKIFFQSQTRS